MGTGNNVLVMETGGGHGERDMERDKTMSLVFLTLY